jgi:uncharacterized BrkB/YihY/UPF0761 family membrane protein
LSNQFIRYPSIYGTLGMILTLLLWIYLSATIIIFGAHVSAAVAIVHRMEALPSMKDEEQ